MWIDRTLDFYLGFIATFFFSGIGWTGIIRYRGWILESRVEQRENGLDADGVAGGIVFSKLSHLTTHSMLATAVHDICGALSSIVRTF